MNRPFPSRSLACFGLLLLVGIASAAEIADLTIRYVNNEVVTMGDVQLRDAIRRADFTRRGQVLPRTRDEQIRFSVTSLEEITDDVLLAQRAKEMGIQADHDQIVLEVLANAKRTGTGLSLRDQAEQRRHLERQRTIDSITSWYESMMPQPRPLDLRSTYDRNQQAYDRPGQVRILQILLRPSSPEERAQIRQRQQALLRQAQDATDPALKTVVDAILAQFLSAEAAEQGQALASLVEQLANFGQRTDLPADDKPLIDEAQALLKAQRGLLDRNDLETRLAASRLSLTGLVGEGQLAAFRALAKQISQGPAASRGGEIGWIEPGLYTKEFDDAAFKLTKGELSPVFWIGEVGCLLLCADRKEAQTRTFDEVSGEIERGLRWQRRQAARARAIAILRAKASIRQINEVDRLLSQ